MRPDPFKLAPIAADIWQSKYRFCEGGELPADATVDDTWRRVAKAAASVEAQASRDTWETRFHEAMADFAFLPAGRIIAGAGTGRQVTLFNCFVMGGIDDDLGSIFNHVREAALTMQQGGGIGHDFSTLRPLGAPVSTLGADASGPVSFMDVWDAMCRTIKSAGARRGAMMGTMRCDHPDIEAFIEAKSDPARLRNFNMSVLVTDAFIDAVRTGADWPLRFGGKLYRIVPARELWERIMRATYDYAEPGVIFIDRVNAENNLAYCETIHCTNPCGEQPLPPYGACLLGSINLTRFVTAPFTASAALETSRVEEHVSTAVRLLDNVIDISNYPLEAQHREAQAKRRIGLGLTGLADALIMCGLRYDTHSGRAVAQAWMQTIQNAAYAASAELACERGSFPLFEPTAHLAAPNVCRLAPEVRTSIAKHGLRNGCLTSIAPTGTISLFAGNVSSGIEPVFDLTYRRKVRNPDNTHRTEDVEDYAYALWRSLRQAQGGSNQAAPPDTFVTAGTISAIAHLEMQATLQPWVDSSISKTINCPADIPFATFENLYLDAYDKGLKGCTTYRPNLVTGSVLSTAGEAAPAPTDRNVSAPSAKPAAAPVSPGSASERIVYMTKPLARSPVLSGYTYKLKWPDSADALYITINDIERDGRLCPFEIFINTKNLDHYAWTVALTRMISAVFRRGGDVSFVVEELKAIFDPQGGRWVEGRYVPSLLAAIGDIIEKHMLRTGLLAEPLNSQGRADAYEDLDQITYAAAGDVADTHPGPALGRTCPQCGDRKMRRAEGCWLCPTCGYSRCT